MRRLFVSIISIACALAIPIPNPPNPGCQAGPCGDNYGPNIVNPGLTLGQAAQLVPVLAGGALGTVKAYRDLFGNLVGSVQDGFKFRRQQLVNSLQQGAANAYLTSLNQFNGVGVGGGGGVPYGPGGQGGPIPVVAPVAIASSALGSYHR